MTRAEASDAINLGLAGRVVLVTGGVRGVGAGISSVFAEQGATVVTCARRAVEGLPYEFHSCDIRDDDAVKELIDTIADRHGRLDVVVNNAGGSPYVLTAESSAKFNRKIIELNLIGALSVSQHANVHMQNQQQGGSIINICSLSGRRPSPGTGAYGAAKAGLESLTQTLAVEWGPKGIRSVAIAPGAFPTPGASNQLRPDGRDQAWAARNPLGRTGEHRELADLASFLISDAGGYSNGEMVAQDGGAHLRSSGAEDLLQWTDAQWEQHRGARSKN